MGVYSGPPSQANDTDKLFLEDLRNDSKSSAPGDFNLPGIKWEHPTAGTTRDRRLLKHLHDSFMEQVLRELTWKDDLDLLLVIREDLLSRVNIGASLATETMEPLSLKSLVTGGKVPEKPQLWP